MLVGPACIQVRSVQILIYQDTYDSESELKLLSSSSHMVISIHVLETVQRDMPVANLFMSFSYVCAAVDKILTALEYHVVYLQ